MEGPKKSPVPAIREFLRRNGKTFLIVLVVLMFGAAGTAWGVFSWLSRDLPTPDRLAHIEPAVKTVVYDARGRVLHEFFRENRSPVPLDRIPAQLVNATIATEDRAFFEHWGIDLWGIGRAAVQNVLQRRIAQGGSTITQLLARNLFLTHERTITRKMKEAILAIEIERQFSKDQILEMYFNQIYFGEGAYGVQAASKTFFAKPLAELTLAECALLAGVPANPSLYSPRRRPNAAKARREKVLRNMLVTEAIGQVEFDRANSTPLGVTPTRYSNDRAPYFTEMVRLYLDERYGSSAVYEGGMKVHTTLDMDLQVVAERALEKHLSTLEEELDLEERYADFEAASDLDGKALRTPYLQGSLVAIDPRNGYVRAIVGGRDWNQSNFNRATQARRQPGSAFKPFIYAAAMDNGFRPTDIIVDEPVAYPGGDGKLYQPGNYDQEFRGPITLRYALQKSVNIPAVKLLRKVGTSMVASYARRMGIKSPLGQNLSLALGTSEVTLYEITSSYSVFANRGIRNEPLFVTRVEDRHGNVLEKSGPRPTEVLSEQTADVMNSMMQSVMDHGTGYGARTRGFHNPAGGKTGTMDDYMDAWFIGYTPSVATGVWVGYDEKRTIGRSVTGARAALPIWTEFMMAASRGKEDEAFPAPPDQVFRTVCAETGMLATTECRALTRETFQQGAEPQELCEIHPGLPRHGNGNNAVVSPPRRPGSRDFRDLDQRARDKRKVRSDIER